MPDLIADNLCKSFDSGSETLSILRGVSLELSAGQNVAIIGPSGSGKSTLLHILGGLDKPDSGHVSLAGTDLASLAPKQSARFRNEKIGFVFQEHYLLPQLSALENVLVPVLAGGAVGDSDVAAARELLAQVGLGERTEHAPAQLSGGERQRVAVARALIRKPLLVLADEPTGSLDAASAEVVGKLLRELPAQKNAMLVCVTHSQTLAAQFERRLTLVGGQLAPQNKQR